VQFWMHENQRIYLYRWSEKSFPDVLPDRHPAVPPTVPSSRGTGSALVELLDTAVVLTMLCSPSSPIYSRNIGADSSEKISAPQSKRQSASKKGEISFSRSMQAFDWKGRGETPSPGRPKAAA
jgi:hypothetical protein